MGAVLQSFNTYMDLYCIFIHLLHIQVHLLQLYRISSSNNTILFPNQTLSPPPIAFSPQLHILHGFVALLHKKYPALTFIV